MSFFNLKNCPFCNQKLEFNRISSLEEYDTSTLKVGFCKNCQGIPLYCLNCGTKTTIAFFKGGIGCPICGNNRMNSCTVPYAN